MISSKMRADLRSRANGLQAIFQIGKSGIEENLIKQVDDALEARELVKIRLLDNSAADVKEAAEELASRTRAEIVQIVGRAIVLWRKSEKLARERAIAAEKAAAQTERSSGNNSTAGRNASRNAGRNRQIDRTGSNKRNTRSGGKSNAKKR